jgi:3-deoxy-manno-octulosonate cytidylyltransferase (CMP-KDO synthetase)
LASRILAVIPARYGSTRFPGKPLTKIAGLPMILHVARKVSRIRGIEKLVVATDDKRILDVVIDDGHAAEMTSKRHGTGTARVAEVAARHNCGIVLNIQGDEPLLPSAAVERLVSVMSSDNRLLMSTLATTGSGADEIKRPDVVKVAVDREGYAMYFSRSPVPHGTDKFLHHIGIYAFRRRFLLGYDSMPRGPFEKAEGLEQLRALENGFRIRVVPCRAKSFGVDRPEDIKRVEKRLGRR